jgi:phosphotransferase system IIA component
MGNEVTFQTEFGVELQIGVGVPEDELLGRFFRPRVVKNEVVVKGKPLLEFDPEGLREEGISPYVFVCVREIRFGSSACVTAEGVLKTGEEIMVIKEPEASGQRSSGQVL